MLKELLHLKLNNFSLSNLGDFMFKSTERLKGSGTEYNRRIPLSLCILLILGLPMIPLYRDGDRTTTKFIQALMKCFASPSPLVHHRSRAVEMRFLGECTHMCCGLCLRGTRRLVLVLVLCGTDIGGGALN
ncbi:hypothetical protein Tco_0096305, partial [Tanacetum coccineum]